MTYTASVDAATIQQWMAAKRTPKTIEDELQAQGLDADAVAAHLKEYKRLRNAKRQFTGFVCMAIGAVLGFISCLLTVTNAFPDLFNTFLYGLTMVAITFVFVGLYFVFE
ncbi:hypothetical protein [Ferruginibacter sp.]|nr:hypothetical protein [Ferruginibacter sp.]